MNRTRVSLYYLATYLWLGGIGLIFAPGLDADPLFSSTDYPPVMLRSLGMFMIGLGMVVVQIVRLRVSMPIHDKYMTRGQDAS